MLYQSVYYPVTVSRFVILDITNTFNDFDDFK